jgi:Predicted phosphohydrolases
MLICLVFGTIILQTQPVISQIFKSDVKKGPTPWTDTAFYNKSENFQFAIVSDRSNGHRAGVFEEAVSKLNGLRPEFVLSIGDFIEGYTSDTTVLHQQWEEFNNILKPLKMPFFRVPGNHDVPNETQKRLWLKQFGRDYYHFIYKDVLFVVMNSTEGDGYPFTKEQLNYVTKTLKDNKKVRWTFLVMHHPVWYDRSNNGFDKIEAELKDRPYTVIAGHTHQYFYATHQERDYFILGTTGGSNKLRGPGFGETDHISWVTMTEQGPSLINLELNGILKPDFANAQTKKMADIIIQESLAKPFILMRGRQKGKVIFRLNNRAEKTLQYNLRAYQQNNVILSKNNISFAAAPGNINYNQTDFRITDNNSAQPDSLEFQWQLYYQEQDKSLPNLAATLKFPLIATIPTAIEADTTIFIDAKKVEIKCEYPNTIIRYTLDGREPTDNSAVYTSPFEIGQTTTVKARLFSEDGSASGTETVTFKKVQPFPPVVRNGKKNNGLLYSYYEGAFKKIPDFRSLKPLRKGIMTSFDLNLIKKDRQNQFALLINGYVEVKDDGLYHLDLTADDGCNLYLDDQLIVDNDGSHSARKRSGFAPLKKGIHKIRLEYFEDFDGELIKIEIENPGKNNKRELTFSELSH